MEYISTRNTQKVFSFKDAFLKGLAPDGGLFIPKKIPSYSSTELEKLKNLSYRDLAAKIILKFCDDEFNENEIKNLINNSYKEFRTKDVVSITKLKKINLLELFHGPTLAFKDIAMQVIGNIYEKILNRYKLKVNIIVATSGDTGAAAISAIKDRKNMKIFVLHPENKISKIQRKFMTTVHSDNVFNISVNSNFDECQKFVKAMFANEDFSKKINMSGVNSINWSRIVIQIVYYFFSYFKIATKNEKINYSVPTGNFGDIYAGYVAKKMGLPINKLIVATNSNDILKRVINTGIYRPSEVIQTNSPSMDIQIASNFERLVFDICSYNSDRIVKLMNNLNNINEFKLEKSELEKINNDFCSESLTAEETKTVINDLYRKEETVIDPHTAVAIGAANKLSIKGKTVVLATAHPSKFSDTVIQATGVKSTLPKNLKNIELDKEKYEKFPNDLKKIQNYILEKCIN